MGDADVWVVAGFLANLAVVGSLAAAVAKLWLSLRKQRADTDLLREGLRALNDLARASQQLLQSLTEGRQVSQRVELQRMELEKSRQEWERLVGFGKLAKYLMEKG